MPDFDHESQQSKRQRPDEVEPEMSDVERLSSELRVSKDQSKKTVIHQDSHNCSILVLL